MALPVDKAIAEQVNVAEQMDGTIQYLPVNEGWNQFPFGPVNSVTPIMFHLYRPGMMNLTDIYCSGDEFSIYDNGVCLGKTSQAIFNQCASNSSNPDFTQLSANWSHGSYNLLPGWHNISIVVTKSPYNQGIGSIRVDTVKEHHDKPVPCTLDVCPIERGEYVVVKTPVPRCQAEGVCQSLGMHLANIDINNFLDATTLAFQCAGPNSQSWVDDWNGDKYQGSCLVMSTGSAAPGGTINVPECCSTHLPVICQKKPLLHPRIQYSCNSCKDSCHCVEQKCHKCHLGNCYEVKSCGLLIGSMERTEVVETVVNEHRHH